VPGQSGSNNGGEKRGGLTKAQWRGITRWIPKEEKSNPLYVMCACALDISHSAPLSEFATNPILETIFLKSRLMKHLINT